MDLEEVAREHRYDLVPAAGAVASANEFSLALPCALVSDGTFITTSLSGLSGHLPCSSALASESIQRFVLLRSEHGFDKAFGLCSSDDPDDNGEEFVRAWDEAQRDLEAGVVVTVNDLVAMVEQARRGWVEVPRRVLLVVRSGDKVTSGTVSVEWVLAGR